jgi:hypothetical protein
MATTITINGADYNLPSQTDNPPWGEELSSLIAALSTVVSSLQGSGDLSLTSFNIANNQSSAANITGASFDVGQVRSAIIAYSVYRSTADVGASECGQIMITYNSFDSTWRLSQFNVGDSGMTFSITSGGQIQYTSSNLSGASYAGVMRFKTTATFLQS